jgi:hypothetical protein
MAPFATLGIVVALYQRSQKIFGMSTFAGKCPILPASASTDSVPARKPIKSQDRHYF